MSYHRQAGVIPHLLQSQSLDQGLSWYRGQGGWKIRARRSEQCRSRDCGEAGIRQELPRTGLELGWSKIEVQKHTREFCCWDKSHRK